jgi:ATP-binding cassette subfamily F protein 3
MIRLDRVSKSFGQQEVLAAVSLEIAEGNKIGLVGRNGAGKSTLVAILLGLEEVSCGRVEMRPGLRIGYVPQSLEARSPDETVQQALLGSYFARRQHLETLAGALANQAGAALDQALVRYQSALDEHEAAGGDAVEKRAAALLDALGLEGRMWQPLATLSGGERSVVGLARALLHDPELLVLDEPGNHLDFDGLAWLEEFLRGFRGAVLVVSHNRYLLDRVVDAVWELDDARLTPYAGNYSRYRLTKLERLSAQQAEYAANQKRLAQLEALVQRFADIARAHADPAWGKRLRARRSQLARERAQAVARPEVDTRRPLLRVETAASRADIALSVAGYERRQGERVLFRGASLELRSGERVALIGANGSGKTTFLRDLAEQGAWDHPCLRIGPSQRVGYADQHQRTLPRDRTVGQFLTANGAGHRSRVAALLSRYLFVWSDLDKRIGDLSGGERNRLQLACLELVAPDFLILDEPTNHMDHASCEAIEEALVDFRGTLLIVSHDRYLLDKLNAEIVELEAGQLRRTGLVFSEYFAQLAPARREARVHTRGRTRREAAEPRVASDARRASVSRSSSDGTELERRITVLEVEKSELEASITRALAAGDHQRGRKLSTRLATLRASLERLYERWLALDAR